MRTVVALVVFLAVALAGSTCPAANAPAKPNIIFLLTDDMGLGDVGCYGGTLVPTPNIDRMAAEGTRFTQYYSASPICSPSRCGLITGNFPARWRITSFLQTKKGNRGCEQADFLSPEAPSLPRQLKAAGYATAHVGKWHLGGGRDVTEAPKFAAYGYDEHAGTYESPEPDPSITATDWIWSPKDKVKRWDRTGYFVDRTLEFMKRQNAAGKPAFVNLWLDDPHTPWVPDENAKKGDTPANLKGVLAETDRQVGRLLAGVKEAGGGRETILIFTSDNGPLPTFQGSRSAGHRGAKLSLYEAGVRMPFIVHWPGRAPAGRVDEQTVLSAVDMFPTLCAIAGAEMPKNANPDGQDMSAALKGTGVPERQKPLFWEYGRNDEFFRYPRGRDRSPNVAMRDGDWKLVLNADGSDVQLYDLKTDKAEQTNVADKHPEVTERMKEQALAWRASLPKP